MKKYNGNALAGLACSVSALAMILGVPAAAQDADDQPEGVTTDAPTEEEAEEVEETSATGVPAEGGAIIVTGSRIKQDTFNSISPLQVLTTDASQDVGVFDPAQLLQRDESAAGQQIDATFQGFVLNNGPGSQTLNLRGLGADRTLLLINGRRLAPAGVEGAPTNPSINLLPSSLIERYDLLLDGASSVYGSDAIAGVGNIVLRKDFDGLDLFASGNLNPMGGGDDYQVSAAWGKAWDRALFGIGAEYARRDTVRLRDRDFLAGCDRNYEITDSGEIRTIGLRDNALIQEITPGISVSENACKVTGISGRIFSPFQRYGSIYYTPDAGNSGIPNFNESNIGRTYIDSDGDGLADVDFQNVNTNGSNPDQVFIAGQHLYNVMAYGEYTFEGAGNITPFFEANYSRADTSADNEGAYQLFPYVPALNPFNPCNFVSNPDGVDCSLAEATLYPTPGVNTGFALPVQPIVSIAGDRSNFDVRQEQYRFVGGVRGDLPFIAPSWTFELAGVYSRSEGRSVRKGIREDKLAFALGLDPTADYDGDGVADNNGNGIADDYQNALIGAIFGGNTPCDASSLANPDLAMPDLLDGCVAVNLFAPSVLGGAIGDFASQAERDYLFGERVFNTVYEQKLLSGFVTGDIFSLPAGNVAVVLGAEYREDKIDSQPDIVASDGLFWGYFSDQGAEGSKWIREAFGEINIPLQAGKPWVEEFNLNLSGRITDEEFYGTAGTYSIKAGWRPVDPLLLKFSYGTSFRAPNLRENFLAGQSGFLSLLDPCAVPVDAYDTTTGAYDPAEDDRDASTLANCRREGRDPESVGVNPGSPTLPPIQVASVEITSGGSLDLDPETSRSLTAGAAFEENFGGFDVSLNVNYYDIKVKDAIIEPSSQFILNDCYTRQDGIRSQFCDRITVDESPNGRGLVTDVFAGFLNLDEESVRGLDLNGFLGREVPMFGKNIDFGINLRANHLIERSTTFVDDSGVRDVDDDTGEFGFPKWTGRATFTAEMDRWLFTWQTRWVGQVEQQEDGVDPLADAFGNGPDGNPVDTNGDGLADFFGDTCTGGGSANGNVAGDGVFCRDVGFADDYFVHTASVRYRDDRFTIRAGVTNLFDTAPPLVDSNEVFAIANTPIGNGYDLDGREFFLAVETKF